MSLSALDQAIAEIKNTPSGEIEYNANSLATVLLEIRNVLAQRNFIRVNDASELQDVDPAETVNVYVRGMGLFLLSQDSYDPDVPNSYPAIGGGSWIRESTESIYTLKDVDTSNFADGKALVINSDQEVEARTPSVQSVAFSNITSKPTTLNGYGITDAAPASHSHPFSAITNKPTTLGDYGITDGFLNTGGTITGDLVVTGNTTLGDSSGDTTTVTGNIQAANVSASGVDTDSLHITIGLGLPNYANNAAAITAGANQGDVYRNGGVLQIVI